MIIGQLKAVTEILKANIKLHSIRGEMGVFTVTSFEQIAGEICQVFEPKHLGKAEFKTAFADELLDQMTGDEK